MQFASIDDIVTLTEDWTFILFRESRNGKFWDAQAYGHLSAYGGSMHIVLPAGTRLVISRIYIRRGKKDFDSITFRIIGHTNKKLIKKSFWAKLCDVRKMKATLEEARCKLNTEEANQSKRYDHEIKYSTMHNCILAVSDTKCQPESDGPEFWITSYGIGCLLPTYDVILGDEVATHLANPLSKAAIILNVKCTSIYNSIISQYVDSETIVSVQNNNGYDYYKAATMNGISVFKMTESNKSYLDNKLNEILNNQNHNINEFKIIKN